MEQIAVIGLSRGQVGYYDDLSRIHLTLGEPEAPIYADTNCTHIRHSIRSGRLFVVSGSLGEEDKKPKKVNIKNDFSAGNFIPEAKIEEVKEEHKEPIKKEIEKEQIKTVANKSTTKETKSKATISNTVKKVEESKESTKKTVTKKVTE